MSKNKKTVEKYNEGFATGDLNKILSCLTEDIVWKVPGSSHLTGEEAFDRIEEDVSVGSPDITIKRMVEENNTVVAESKVQFEDKDSNLYEMAVCEIFHFKNGKIDQLTSYLMEK